MVIESQILEGYKFNPRDIDNWDARDPYYYYWGKFEDDLKKQQKIEKDLSKHASRIKIIKSY